MNLKYLYTFLYFLLATQYILFAQHSYIPIPKNDAVWVTVKEYWYEGTFPPKPHDFSYFVARTEGVDTIINGKKYFCYFGERPASALPMPAPGTRSAFSADWIREDSATKKIWYVRTKKEPYNEELLYDFSLNKGDTINDTNYYYFNPDRLFPYKAWVDDLDSVYWADGTWRYRWWIKSFYGGAKSPSSVTIIEGLGYTNNFLDDPLRLYHPLVSATNEISCYSHKNVWLYSTPNPWNADCDTMISRNIIPVSVPEIKQNELQQYLLYPNPATSDGVIHINYYAGRSNERVNVRAFNSVGKLILSEENTPGGSINLRQYNFPQGTYFFLLLNSQNTIIARQKILIN